MVVLLWEMLVNPIAWRYFMVFRVFRLRTSAICAYPLVGDGKMTVSHFGRIDHDLYVDHLDPSLPL